eukprot:SAG22_NODE_1153_length_5347_cov_16.898819_1_plen_1122_part_10
MMPGGEPAGPEPEGVASHPSPQPVVSGEPAPEEPAAVEQEPDLRAISDKVYDENPGISQKKFIKEVKKRCPGTKEKPIKEQYRRLVPVVSAAAPEPSDSGRAGRRTGCRRTSPAATDPDDPVELEMWKMIKLGAEHDLDPSLHSPRLLKRRLRRRLRSGGRGPGDLGDVLLAHDSPYHREAVEVIRRMESLADGDANLESRWRGLLDKIRQKPRNLLGGTTRILLFENAENALNPVAFAAYCLANYPHGAPATFREMAFEAYRCVLEHRGEGSGGWASAQMNLALINERRVRGNHAENLEAALRGYDAALTVWTRELFPTKWANTQKNMGIAFKNRLRGTREHNLNKAVECQEGALAVFTQDEDCESESADCQLNLSNALREIGTAEARQKAAVVSEETLAAVPRQKQPHQWAGACVALAMDLQRSDAKRAITLLQDALTVWTRDKYPHEWARAHMNLGGTYQNIEGRNNEATAAFESALKIFTQQAHGRSWATATQGLASCYISLAELADVDQIHHCQQAIACLTDVLSYHEDTRTSIRESTDNAVDSRAVTKDVHRCTAVLVKCLMLDGDSTRTLELVEKVRARELADLCNSSDSAVVHGATSSTQQFWITKKQALRKAQRLHARQLHHWHQVSECEDFLRQASEEQDAEIEITEMRKHIDACISSLGQALKAAEDAEKEARKSVLLEDPDFQTVQPILDMKYDAIQEAVLGAQTVAAVWVFFPGTWSGVFVAAMGLDKPRHLQYTSDDEREIISALETFHAGGPTDDAVLAQLSKALRMDDVHNLLREGDKDAGYFPPNAPYLVLLSTGILSAVPLHALPLPVQRNVTLSDVYTAGCFYAPSLRLFANAKRFAGGGHTVHASNFVGVGNPTCDLPGAEQELTELINIAGGEDCATVLSRTDATAAHVAGLFRQASKMDSYVLHVACHLVRDTGPDAWQSALQLAHKSQLTAAELASTSFGNCRMCVISACESARHSVLFEEHISMASALLVASIPCVVSTLWPVHDFSALLFMTEFYKHLQQKQSATAALRNAQVWLRRLCASEIRQLVPEGSFNEQLRIGSRPRSAVAQVHCDMLAASDGRLPPNIKEKILSLVTCEQSDQMRGDPVAHISFTEDDWL